MSDSVWSSGRLNGISMRDRYKGRRILRKAGSISAMLFLVLGMAGCRASESLCGEKAPDLFLTKKNKVFAFDAPSFNNFLYYVKGNRILPACARQQEWVELCGAPARGKAYAKSADLEKLPGGLPGGGWGLRFIEAKGQSVRFHFVMPPEPTTHFPAHWVMRDPLSKEIIVGLAPVARVVTASFINNSNSLVKSFAVEEGGGPSTVVRFKGEEVVGVRDEWESPIHLRLDLITAAPRSKTIVIDPGHGGSESGTCEAGECEKHRVLEAARILAEMLADSSTKVVLTREADETLSLEARVEKAERGKADLLISLHIDNWLPSMGFAVPPRGLTCYFFAGISSGIAESLCELMREKGYRSDYFARRSLYVLHSMEFPSVLLELGNQYDAEDRKLLNDPVSFRKYLADIAAVIKTLKF